MFDFQITFHDGSLKGRSVWVRARSRGEANTRANEMASVSKATGFELEAI